MILLFVMMTLMAVAQNAAAQDSTAATVQDSTTTVIKKVKKERKVTLSGQVYDSFTKAKVKALMTLMREDSTVIDTMTCWTWGTYSQYYFEVKAQPQKFIIKGSCEGYEDAYQNYEIRYLARNRTFEVPNLMMKKKLMAEDIWREDTLGGVVVRGTKVKIAYHGDTIVYNAAAFNLPEGSMLDGLIRQLPGAELKSNGDIYINGEKVDYLTLNGKDFFKGQNKVMLDNLPYYTVQNLKVFHKSTKQSQLVGRDIEKKDFVMDVNLKREYNRGYMANLEVGGGTSDFSAKGTDRYMGRLFGLYYTDHSRYSLYGNMNNINENRTPGGEGDWQPSNMPQGLITTKQVGLDFSTEDADKRFEEEGNISVDWDDATNESRTTSETFASDGSIFGGAWSASRQKDVRVHVNNNLTMLKPFRLYSNLSFDYSDGRSTSESEDSTYRAAVINQSRKATLRKHRSLSGSGDISFYHHLPWGDYLLVQANGQFSCTKPSDDFSRQNVHYPFSSTSDNSQERYADTRSDTYSWQTSLSYNITLLNKWNIVPSMSYNQKWQSNYNSNYRLDWLGNTPAHELGWLPSTRDSLLAVVDFNNSDENELLTRRYRAALTLDKSTDDFYVGLILPFDRIKERLHYDDGVMDTIAHRTYNHFQPMVFLYFWKGGMKMIRYNYTVNHPELASLMPVDDTTNPLVYRVNNPDLKKLETHNFEIRYTRSVDSLKRNYSVWGSLRIERNKWGTQSFYNTTDGSYAYMNDNVNGNWNSSLGTSFALPLDKKRFLLLSQEMSANYEHNVDFDVFQGADLMDMPDDPPLSTVNNWTLHDHLQLQYQKELLTASLSGNITWRNSTGDRQNFQRINAFDFDYGASLNYTIPWVKIGVATDIRMFSRRGYQTSMMNDNHLVWNAQLTRSLLKGKLTAKLQAFDLLHQLSDTQYSVNAQGRTETWRNCIPRYVMLSLLYKFTKAPKGGK